MFTIAILLSEIAINHALVYYGAPTNIPAVKQGFVMGFSTAVQLISLTMLGAIFILYLYATRDKKKEAARVGDD